MQGFLKEQTEEMATMSDLQAVVTRSADHPEAIEDYLAREHPGAGGADPTAPPVAGAGSASRLGGVGSPRSPQGPARHSRPWPPSRSTRGRLLPIQRR